MESEPITPFRRHPILSGARQAPTYNRLVAKGIDALVVFAAYVLVGTFSHLLATVLACIWFAGQDSLGNGQSIGKRIMGVKVVDDFTGLFCTLGASFQRNWFFSLGVLCAAFPALWAFLVLIVIPVIVFEIYLMFSLESGTRLGDAVANTLVTEAFEEQPFSG